MMTTGRTLQVEVLAPEANECGRQPILAVTEIRIEARGGSRARKGRRAKLELRAARVALLLPKDWTDEPDLTMLADIPGT